MMKKILIYSQDSTGKKIFDEKIRDNCSQPFIFLKKKLEELGYELDTCSDIIDLSNEVRWLLFINSPFSKSKPWWKKFLNFKKNTSAHTTDIGQKVYHACLDKKISMALFLWEGEAIRTDNYNKKIFDKFPIIFTWKNLLVDNEKFYKFYLPIPDYRLSPEVQKIDFKNKKLLINISRNRKSNFPRELYSEREKSIAYFDQHFNQDFDLYGMDWNKPRNRWQKIIPLLTKNYSCYRGEINNKVEVMPHYKFSLSYENLSGENDYITEKIFDCMNSKVVPIYWGAENIEEYVATDSFIDRRLFKTNQELADYIKNISEIEYENYLQAAERYLKSKKFQNFLPKNFADTIIKTLKL